MHKLLPVAVLSIVLAFGSHTLSDQDGRSLLYRRKEVVLYLALTIVMAFFVGLRTAYNDTYVYVDMYNDYDVSQGVFASVTDWSLGSNPGFWLLNGWLKQLHASAQSFLMCYAILDVGLYLWFLRRHTCSIWMTIFVFITFGCYTFTLAAIKQCTAVALALVGVEFSLKKKWVPFVLFVLLATTFHPYALMFLIAPFMTFKPWTRLGFLVLALFLVLGFSLQSLLGTLVNVTTLLGEEYDIASFSGEGINPFRLAVCAVPLVLSLWGYKTVWKEATPTDCLMINLSLLNAEIMFVGLFGTANYFGRLANYFSIFQCLSIPWLMRIFTRRSKALVTVCAVVGYLAYFYYANAINQHFDSLYRSVSLLDYLKSLL